MQRTELNKNIMGVSDHVITILQIEAGTNTKDKKVREGIRRVMLALSCNYAASNITYDNLNQLRNRIFSEYVKLVPSQFASKQEKLLDEVVLFNLQHIEPPGKNKFASDLFSKSIFNNLAENEREEITNHIRENNYEELFNNKTTKEILKELIPEIIGINDALLYMPYKALSYQELPNPYNDGTQEYLFFHKSLELSTSVIYLEKIMTLLKIFIKDLKRASPLAKQIFDKLSPELKSKLTLTYR